MSDSSVLTPAVGAAEPVQSPFAPSALRDLLVRPSRFFSCPSRLSKRPELLIAAWIAGMAACIDRIDRNILRSQLGDGQRSQALETMFAGSWMNFWGFVVVVGIPSAALLYLIAGWWYRKRLEWSGAIEPSKELARNVWVYQNLVQALPGVLLVVVYTFFYSDYLQAFNAEELWSAFVLIFVFWSCVTSYVGATTAFTVSRAKATIWFLVLPLAIYTVAVGAIGVLMAMFGEA